MSKRKNQERAEAGQLHRGGELVTPEQAGKIDKAKRKVEGLVQKALGKKIANASLDKLAKAAIKLIEQIGSDKMRGKVIQTAEDDIRDAISRGLDDEAILKPALDSPNYMKMWAMVGLDESHLRAIIKKQRGR